MTPFHSPYWSELTNEHLDQHLCLVVTPFVPTFNDNENISCLVYLLCACDTVKVWEVELHDLLIIVTDAWMQQNPIAVK